MSRVDDVNKKYLFVMEMRASAQSLVNSWETIMNSTNEAEPFDHGYAVRMYNVNQAALEAWNEIAEFVFSEKLGLEYAERIGGEI